MQDSSEHRGSSSSDPSPERARGPRRTVLHAVYLVILAIGLWVLLREGEAMVEEIRQIHWTWEEAGIGGLILAGLLILKMGAACFYPDTRRKVGADPIPQAKERKKSSGELLP